VFVAEDAFFGGLVPNPGPWPHRSRHGREVAVTLNCYSFTGKVETTGVPLTR